MELHHKAPTAEIVALIIPRLLSLGRLPLWRPCLAAMLRIGLGRLFRGPATVMTLTTTVTHYRAVAIRCTIP